MSLVPVERAPQGLLGCTQVNIKYSGRHIFWGLLPQRWQAWLCARSLVREYHAAGFPAQGIAFQLPSGAWYGVDGPDGSHVWKAK